MGLSLQGRRVRLREWDRADPRDRRFVTETLARFEVWQAFGIVSAPAAADVLAGQLWVHRGGGPDFQAATVYTVGEPVDEERPSVLLVDYGWDYPEDPIREIDVAVPARADRNAASMMDLALCIGGYLFKRRDARALRWRVRGGDDRLARLAAHIGATRVRSIPPRRPFDAPQDLYAMTREEYFDSIRRVPRYDRG